MEPADVQRVVRETFGFSGLRPGQGEIVADVIAGKPVIAVMPTGAGKSLCYQLPAVVLSHTGAVTLVVSPLIALMKDQVDGLRQRGIAAAALTSASSPGEQRAILDGIRQGAYPLVYVAPERFRSRRFVGVLAELGPRIGLLAIDEAHCISEWGHEFRPDYRRLGEAVRALQPPRLIALTATATPEVREDIASQLAMAEPALHVHGFDRPNLHYSVEPCGGATDKSTRLVDRVRRRASGVALVYAATRKNAERYAGAVQQQGMRVRVYHAGLDDAARHAAQDAFMGGELDVIVATNAFGMGVDKANIHLVIHADLPRSIEAYYQESGRAGRDGQRAESVLLFNHGDVRLQEFLIDATYPNADTLRGTWHVLRQQPNLGNDLESLRLSLPDPPHLSSVESALRILERHGYAVRDGAHWHASAPADIGEFAALDVMALQRRADVERSKLRTMVEYGYHARCRRQYMLAYFGDADWLDRDCRCSGCDNCKGLSSAVELNDDQRAHVRALLGLTARLSGRFGRARLAGIANGTDDDPRFAGLDARGCSRGQSSRAVMDLLRALEGAGLVDSSGGQYPTVGITPRGRRVLSGAEDIDRLSWPGKPPAGRARVARGSTNPAAGPADAPLDSGLVDRLRALRRELAAEREVPPYVVFSNKTLEALARARPSTLDALAAVHGMGPSRMEAYGRQILEILSSQ
jgi:ATP-dependent DNA helicase RecQ